MSPPMEQSAGASKSARVKLVTRGTETTVILVSLFSDGSASYDKELKGWVSAGFGFVAVEGGDGPVTSSGSLTAGRQERDT